jgi:hypothetical protein
MSQTNTSDSGKNRPRPFIPKRPAPEKSVYSAADHNPDGSLKVLRKVPDGPRLAERRSTVLASSSRGDNIAPPAIPNLPKEDDPRPVQTSVSAPKKNQYAAAAAAHVKQYESAATEDMSLDEGLSKAGAKHDHIRRTEQADAAAHKPSQPEDRVDKVPEPAGKHVLGVGKYDIQTAEKLRAPHQSQYVAVIRTIENHHPDEDRILQHYFLQYVARKEGRYNPIDDPPVVMGDIIPTICVVIDRVFSFDEVQGDGLNRLKNYVKSVATNSDMDVVPVTMNKAFHLPLHPGTAFKYKHKVIDQIMSEWHESHEESASDILSRIERDRAGKPAEKTPWHVYDGVSEQGVFGPQSNNKIDSIAVNKEWVDINTPHEEKPLSWADQTDLADEEEEEELPRLEPKEEEWTTVKRKPVRAGPRGRGQPRRSARER